MHSKDLIRKPIARRNVAKTRHMTDGGSYLYAICIIKSFKLLTYRFDSKTEKWSTVGQESKCLTGSTVAVMGRNIYVIGGCNMSGKCLATVKAFNIDGYFWAKARPMMYQRCRVAAVSMGTKLFVCGGQTENAKLENCVECYCLQKKCWEVLPPMLYSRSGASAASLHESIYILGEEILAENHILKRSLILK